MRANRVGATGHQAVDHLGGNIVGFEILVEQGPKT
jgi:hypothetical protein